MRNRKLALILSFIYSGLGQIYKRQVLKGIDFAILYTIGFVAAFSSTLWLRRFGFSLVPFMWIVGMLDAYMESGMRRRWLLVLPGVFASLLVFGIYILLTMDGSPKPDLQQAKALPKENIESAQAPLPEKQEQVETASAPIQPEDARAGSEPEISEFFSVQVAAFRKSSLNQAEELRDEYLSEGYQARIEDPLSPDDAWYRVLIGKFRTEQEARVLKDRLEREKELPFVIFPPRR